MSTAKMDLVDHEFMVSLFPRYLLKQPVAHDLWKLYYQHKKLFHKLKTKDEILNSEIDSSKSLTIQEYKNPNRLTLATRKEIWEKLSQLGVLGTIPYDSLSDDYLIQVHKYFYTRDEDSLYKDFDGDLDMSKPDLAEEENTGDMRAVSDEENERDGVSGEEDEHTPEHALEHELNEGDRNEEDVDVDDDDDGGIESDEDSSENSDNENVRNSQSADTVSSKSSSSRIAFFSEVKESKHPIQLKSNPVPGDIYKTLGYPLPHRWILQADNSVLISQDGSAMLRVNPNWHVLSSYGRASPIMNSRLRVNINSQKKQQWATTWANNGINHSRCAIFYFEIRILSVTSSQAGRNSHVLVGFKNWSKVNDKVAGSDPEVTVGSSAPSSSHSNMLRNVLDGNRNITSSSSSSSQAQNGDIETYSYSGLDGNKFNASGSQKYSRPFGRDDIVGCGVNFIDGTIFFTKNGIFLGNAFSDCFDTDLVPFISIKTGNSVRTNFGLTEEFLFDIDQYQLQWKYKAFSQIFRSIDDEPGLRPEDDESDAEGLDKLDSLVSQYGADVEMEESNPSIEHSDPESSKEHPDGFLLSRDTRFSGDKLWKPETAKLNNINPYDDSIPSQLNSMINDYLIHEGYIDVAKGFLKDLQRDCIPNNSDERARIVIRHNERQILKEEKNLQIRQTVRHLIHEGEILKCMKYIDQQFPDLLEKYLELTFEMKCADYLRCLSKQSPESDLIESILMKGQDISNQFLQNDMIPEEQRIAFRLKFDEISPLMAYSNPSTECTDDRSFYLTPAYLQERLFQTVNTHILQHLDKRSQSSLENMIGYSRAMINTLMEYDNSNLRDNDLAYYKLVNIDEDLLKL